MNIESILTPDAPQPAGHYSQGIVYNGLVYVAGQVAIDAATGERKLNSIEEQTEQVIKNVQAILRAAGSDLDHLLKVTVYISEPDLWGPVNEVYQRLLGGHRPARAIVPVKTFHGGFAIEMEAIGAVKTA